MTSYRTSNADIRRRCYTQTSNADVRHQIQTPYADVRHRQNSLGQVGQYILSEMLTEQMDQPALDAVVADVYHEYERRRVGQDAILKIHHYKP